MGIENVITGLTVCWNTKELIQRSVGSIHRFHPEMKIIIVDGSPIASDCYKYLSELNRPNIEVFQVGKNIGHGRGMVFGIEKIKTPYVLIFDSDIEMVKSPVQGMLEMMEDNTFGVGYCEHVGIDGHDYGVFPRHKHHPPIKYMHPYFHLLQIKEYKKYKPYIHHGAPCIRTMIDIHKKGLSEKVLKEFKGLGHTNGCGMSWKPCAGEYVIHNVEGFGGTGKMRVAKGLPHIEGAWEPVFEPVKPERRNVAWR